LKRGGIEARRRAIAAVAACPDKVSYSYNVLFNALRIDMQPAARSASRTVGAA
jgi:hypothetical protein